MLRELRLAIRFLIQRGFIFDPDYPSWSHPCPEHFQPTEGELEAANVIDKASVSFFLLCVIINNVKKELKSCS